MIPSVAAPGDTITLVTPLNQKAVRCLLKRLTREFLHSVHGALEKMFSVSYLLKLRIAK